MGIRPSFPIKHDQLFFEPPSNYSCFGKARAEEITHVDTSLFHRIRKPFWEDLVTERKIDLEAKKKYYDMDEETIEALTTKFEKFDAGDLEDLRFLFQCFDINGDGLIDKPELMQVLDDMGDKSGPDEREQCFLEVDEDGSGAIDFEEFLGLIYRLRYELKADDEMNTIALMSKRESDKVKALRKLSISEQMSNKLF